VDLPNLAFDATLFGTPGSDGQAAALEAAGASAGWVTETTWDPFLSLTEAALHTSTLRLGTSVAVALARNPMSVAVTANHLQTLSGGRLILGLGSQVKAHIVRRFSMPWTRPAARMREFALALRAIWAAWADSTPLAFEGEFYTHTLMSPLFDPGPNPYGPPPMLLSGVGPVMTEIAGEVADGFLVAPLAPPDFLRDHVLPRLDAGRERSGRDRGDFTVSAMPFVSTGRTDAERAAAKVANRARIAFYASTPAYAPVLEYYGLGDLRERLSAHARDRNWAALTGEVSDEMLEVFSVEGTPAEVLPELRRRYAGLADRVTLYSAHGLEPDLVKTILEKG
jgi:probable F420-dependent oxidoreductase